MKQIRLSQGLYALVNDEDYEWLCQWNWYASQESRGTKWYAVRRENGKKIRMHVEIVKRRLNQRTIDNKLVVDHVNHNSLDNRYWIGDTLQLELITQAENMRRSPGWKRKGVKNGPNRNKTKRSKKCGRTKSTGKDNIKERTVGTPMANASSY